MSTFFLLLFLSLPLFTFSQPQTPLAPSPAPLLSNASDACNGIFLNYTYTQGKRLPPRFTDKSQQPYSFQSTAIILNHDLNELQSWQFKVGFQYNEYLVSASNAVIVNGSNGIPGNVTQDTVFAGFPVTDLKSAVETAGDENQMSVEINFLGTQYGVADPDVPMPTSISLVNDGYICRKPTLTAKNLMEVCCDRDPNFKVNVTVDAYLPRQSGDLTIDYDVLRSYDTEYYAQVKISNHNPLGRLDNWKLSWEWMREEFITSMKGASPSVVDPESCIFGSQGAYYKDFDFTNALTCEKTPTIIDLPLDKTNDSTIGMIPFCCRNGTILPTSMDPSKSISAFQLQVKKMPPDLNRTEIYPPQNWKIIGTLNPDYQCGPPVRVDPGQYPDPSGMPVNKTAVASWQVVCNITEQKGSSPRCCVTFSAFYNDSVIPCRTCACGCQPNPSQTCSTTAPALLLKPQSALVPFDNRTEQAKEWARIIHRPVPNPLPCGDNCGVSINWHVNTDYRKGWSARITLFNWGETNFADWFTAVQFDKATPGFEKMYSFNGSALEGVNNTIFMEGLPGLNYLVGEVDGANPARDPRVPGKQQSVISFTKKATPGINIAAGDGFPTKVFFNGEECSLPTSIPSNSVHKTAAAMSLWSPLLAIVVLFVMQQ
ncbi:hypothetical protein IFM89_005631 [Coptis chinensis]|uniref:COBRA C-terminal domain-containing protein n=1 Tax=Coptis chinensis TaxID=261450 RepID=A0A835HR58_9MAGN|nr:hypothetical protein IFM89_005631 [Coptis chinensis]